MIEPNNTKKIVTELQAIKGELAKLLHAQTTQANEGLPLDSNLTYFMKVGGNTIIADQDYKIATMSMFHVAGNTTGLTIDDGNNHDVFVFSIPATEPEGFYPVPIAGHNIPVKKNSQIVNFGAITSILYVTLEKVLKT